MFLSPSLFSPFLPNNLELLSPIVTQIYHLTGRDSTTQYRFSHIWSSKLLDAGLTPAPRQFAI